MARISAKRRFGWLFGCAGTAGIAVAVAALAWISKDGAALPLHMIISVSLASIMSMLLAAGLMGLIFLSSDSGHDQIAADEAAKQEPEGWQ
ncbi:hypothetical protein KCG44_13210 [Pacificimonas sp. WHA3]|uniref:Uncharacterized protein n=1 Tax=Pacificimonas pallii TaxID=2827236 RepID=A0ABS6SHM6_9SPHN|nr:hypothetical protein [Pacificimonas pallii]MBV7257745.1 hypothetical protein [Pacificimonas pallii]